MLYVALIHNQEPNRIATARQCASMLSQVTGADQEVQELWWQPHPLREEQIHKLVVSDARFCVLAASWSRYLGRKCWTWLSAFKFFLRAKLPDYLTWSSLKTRCRRRTIEIFLTAKHIQAWEKFLQSEARYLAVMESDVALNEHTKARLEKELLPLLVNTSSEQALYIDLAGGCTERELGCANLSVVNIPGFVCYEKAITNTACAYIISKPLAEKFVSAIWQVPNWRNINADWLMNLLFMKMQSSRGKVVCYHAQPPIFKHGSVEAVYASEIR